MNFDRLGPAVLLAAAIASPAFGQAAAGDRDELKQRIEKLEQEAAALRAALAGQASAPPAQQGGSAGIADDAAAPESLEALDQKLRVLDRRVELDKEAADAKAAQAPVVTAGRDGFGLRSADSAFRVSFGAYVQSDGRFYLNTTGTPTSTFLLRRVRPSIQGTIYKNIDFRLMPDFGGGSATVVDAYVELRQFKRAALRAGKFKPPVGLEQLQGDQDTVFVERGLPTNLVPNRDIGVQLSGDFVTSRLNYAVGVFNGAPDGTSSDGDTNSRKDFAARLFATPFQPLRAGNPLKGLGFGIATSIGRQTGSLPGFKTPGQAQFFTYSSGVTAAGARTRYSPQAYYYYGPLGVVFEFVRSAQKVARAGAVTQVGNKAWQVAGSYFLTGEAKGFKSTPPLQDFDPAKGGWGAFELIARVERLAVDPAVYALGLADRTASARSANGLTGGVNWYLNRNVKLTVNYSNTRFTGGSARGDRVRESSILTRFQVGF